MVAPCQVQLERGLIYVPLDKDEVVTRLRFAIGDRVMCNTGDDTWEHATVVALMYQEAGMPEEVFAPYQLKLDTGALIYAPADSDGCVRKA